MKLGKLIQNQIQEQLNRDRSYIYQKQLKIQLSPELQTRLHRKLSTPLWRQLYFQIGERLTSDLKGGV